MITLNSVHNKLLLFAAFYEAGTTKDHAVQFIDKGSVNWFHIVRSYITKLTRDLD